MSSSPQAPADVILSGHFIAGTIVATTIAVFIVWLRMYTRAFVSHQTGWDDWIMLIASFVTIVDTAFLVLAYHYGIGRHIQYLSGSQIEKAFKWLWAGEPTNLFAIYLVRVSVSVFLLRLVPSNKKIYARMIWISIIVLSVANLYVSINYFVQCRPIEKVWKPTIPGKCLSPTVYAAAPWAYSASSIAGDVVTISIPIYLFKDLQVKRKTKIGLIVILCLGVFTCICAIVKTVLLPNLFNANPDKSWILAQLILWAILELDVGMICGSVPALRPLFIRRNQSTPYRNSSEQRKASSNRLKESHQEPPFSPGVVDDSAGDTGATMSLEETIPVNDSAGEIRATTRIDIVSALRRATEVIGRGDHHVKVFEMRGRGDPDV